MSKPVTDRAFVTAWPGSGLPNTDQSRQRPRREDEDGHDAGHPDQAEARGAVEAADADQATTAQTRPSQSASLRVSAARPMQDAERR